MRPWITLALLFVSTAALACTGIGPVSLGDNLTFGVVTSRFSTGAAYDAGAVPAYRVYEDETATPILTGNMALLDDANTVGLYSEQIAVTSGNGFERGKSYTIHIAATVDSVAGATCQSFAIPYLTDSSGRMGIDLDQTAGTIGAAEIGTDAITAAKIAADAIGASEIAADAIGASEIATGAIDADAIAADAIGASEIATDAITAAEVAANAIGASELATDAVAEIVDGVWDETATGHTDAGKAGEQLWTDVDAILVDTAAYDTNAELGAAVWTYDVSGIATEDQSGYYLRFIRALTAGNIVINKSTGVLTVYDTDGSTTLATYALTDTTVQTTRTKQ